MLAYYTNEDEYKRHATPRAVLEVVAVREWDGASALKTYKHALEIDYLGGATYQCHCDSSEDKALWLQAIRHALDEPDRIMQDEIEDAQQRLLSDAETEEQALAQAADAVRTAQKLGQDALSYEQSMKDNAAERHALEEKLAHTKVLLTEAAKKANETRLALARARESAHDAALHADARSDDDGDEARDSDDGLDQARPRRSSSASPRRRAASLANEATERVARLAAQLEVDTTLEETHKRDVAALDQRVIDLSHDYAELFRKSRECAEESQTLRTAAATSLQQAQSAKQLAKLRIESWTTSASHLDPLADGYLLCKHPYKPTMHRRYYVLFGNTLCWYKDADTYAALADSPAGVVHVSGVTEWNGKAGGMKVLPHAFSIVTVEGKVLCCSAPTRQSATTWTTALHIGIAMPPLSPHRAVAAKSRRDSFDLMSSMATLSPKKKGSGGHFQFPSQGDGESTGAADATKASVAPQDGANESADASAPTSREALEATVVVEGYLVKKSAFVPVMKKKYCVLKGLRLYLFDSHDAYVSSSATHDEIQVCSVADWDGHGALLHYHYGFQIETLRHQAIYCSAANNEEKDKWVHGIRASLLKHRERLLSPTRREDSMIDRARKRLLRRSLEQTGGETGDGTPPQVQELDESAAAHDEFHALLHEFYAEHNASKLSDVPMLVERYAQRERTLVEHLDRIYGTALAQDAHVIALLDRLAATKQQLQSLVRRKSSGVTSGLVDFVKMAGYLAWNTERCYCILSINKLVRYRTQTQYETAPYDPIEAIVIASVYEYPPPPDFVPSASAKNTFFVSYYASELEDAPHAAVSVPVTPSQLALSASTVDEKLQWMAKIRSGLGFVHASAATGAAAVSQSTSSGHDAGASSASSSSSNDALRHKLLAYYKEHNPRKVGEVETLLVYFRGNELELLRDLDATYGTSIASDPDVVALVPTTAAAARSTSSAAQYESYLLVKHPALGLAFQRCYCVLRDETWSCYRSSRDAHADGSSSRGDDDASSGTASDSGSSLQQQQAATPLLVDVVTSLHTRLEPKQTLATSFIIETLANGPVLLRADVDKLAQDWTRVLRRAVDTYQRDEQARELECAQTASDERQRTSSVLVVPVDGPVRQLYDLLVAFYELHNRDKVAEVGTLLHAFRGRERALLEQIDRIYHSALCSDATFTALLEEIAAYYDEQQRLRDGANDRTTADTSERDADAQEQAILMEGYLVKRGHLMPSMRKRYCVLVKTTLTYYATHQDSRNPNVAPHGRFQVDVVSDWSGKTATKTYDHGLELETIDGKTFFCAAYSAEDKAKWLRAFKHGLAIARAEQATESDTATGSGDQVATGDDANGDGEEDSSELKADRLARKAQFKDRLVAFYRETNPKKLADLDLLLSCYTQREFALLEAIDAAYGSALAHDPTLLALVPPTSAHTRALAALQYDGSLVRCSDSAWKRAQSVYVALNGLVLTFYASREGFKSSSGTASASGSSVTLLAVKDVASDGSSSSAAATRPTYRFAVETTEHVWVYLEAPNSVEKRHWLQLLHAALDTILAQSLLEEELTLLQSSDARWTSKRGLLRRDSSFAPDGLSGDSGWKGFLLVRMDFASEAEHLKKRECAVAMEERHFVLHKHNQLVVYNDVQDAIVATFTTLSTRAWEPPTTTASGSAPIVMRGDIKCRFPFQIVTLEQIVLSCSAATDLLRAKWIKQIRAGAERATALELLQDQERQTQLEEAASASTSGEIIIAPASDGLSLASDNAVDAGSGGTVVMQGYLDYKVTESAAVPPATSPSKEGYFVLTTRADVDVYADEGAFYRRDAPLFTAQAIELLDPQLASPSSTSSTLTTPPPLSPSLSTRRHLHKLFGESANASSRAFSVQTKDKSAPFIHVFAASTALHERWVDAFRAGIDLVKGEELLADEKLILRLEEAEAEAKASSTHKDDTVGDVTAGALVAGTTPGVVLEGSLTPWRLTFSSPRPTATTPLYYVLVGCRLRGFASQSEITGALSTTRTENDHSSVLDAEVVSVSDWEAPTTAPTASSSPTNADEIEGVGFQIEVVVPPSQSRETLYFTAPTSARKHAWVCGLKRELDFALAESYLDDDAREFARQVAAHVADTGRPNQSGDGNAPHIEGYVRVRHHFLGALWRERYAVLDNTRLLLFSDASGAQSADRERTAVEKHDLVAVEKWHPTYSASLGSHSASRVGFRVENEAGGYLECTVSSQDEQTQWLSAITVAVDALATHASSTRVLQRDAALPFIPGAVMEGYLKTKEPKHTKLFWKTRYCVVIGTQWLLYETQAQAAGGAAADDASVPPLAVYEIAQVEPWTLSDQNADHRSLLDADDELAARAFSVHVSTGVRVDCKAQSSLERKRWVNAMEDEVAKAAAESAQFVDAIEQHRAKESAKAAIKTKYNEVQREAKRQSAYLREALTLAGLDDMNDRHSGSSSSGSSEYSDDDGEDNNNAAQDADGGNQERSSRRLRLRSGSDFIDRSPEWSPIRPKTSMFGDDDMDSDHAKKQQRFGAVPLASSLVACFTRCFARPQDASSSSKSVNGAPSKAPVRAGRSIAPLGVPGFPANADVWTRMYTCEYYTDDGYTSADSDA